MTTLEPLSIGTRPGNLRRTAGDYSCDPVSIDFNNAIPPSSISVFNGTSVPRSFFSSPPNNNASSVYQSLRLVRGLGSSDVGSGRVNWTVDNNVNVGDYVGFVIEDAAGRVAVSELRTIYNGVKGDSTCRYTGATTPEPSAALAPARVGSWEGNVYLPTPNYNCSAAYITYSVDSPPFTLAAFNATGLPPSFFTNLTSPTANVSILQDIATVGYTMGTYTWPVTLPVGTRFGWRVVDRNGVAGYSESRTVYAADERTNQTAFCRRGLVLDKPSGGSSGDEEGLSSDARRGIGLGITFAIAVALFILFVLWKRRTQRGGFMRAKTTSHSGNRLMSRPADLEASSSSQFAGTTWMPSSAPRDAVPMQPTRVPVNRSTPDSLPVATLYTNRTSRRSGPGSATEDELEEQLPSYGDAVKSPPHV